MLSVVAHLVRRIALCCACAGALFAGATAAASAAPEAAPLPVAAPASLAAPAPVPARPGEDVVNFAEQYVGAPYRWGGSSPAGFDCSGFVMFVYRQFGVALPHNEAGQLASGPNVGPDELQPGDVLVFANTYRAGLSHVGIYVGDGQFVHAADERHGVTISSLWDGYWAPRLVGATREVS